MQFLMIQCKLEIGPSCSQLVLLSCVYFETDQTTTTIPQMAHLLDFQFLHGISIEQTVLLKSADQIFFIVSHQQEI